MFFWTWNIKFKYNYNTKILENQVAVDLYQLYKWICFLYKINISDNTVIGDLEEAIV